MVATKLKLPSFYYNVRDLQESSFTGVVAAIPSFPKQVVSFRIIHRKTPVLESMQMFSCEYYKIFKNRFFYRTPPVAASTSAL